MRTLFTAALLFAATFTASAATPLSTPEREALTQITVQYKLSACQAQDVLPLVQAYVAQRAELVAAICGQGSEASHQAQLNALHARFQQRLHQLLKACPER
jgi:hypothetical protein